MFTQAGHLNRKFPFGFPEVPTTLFAIVLGHALAPMGIICAMVAIVVFDAFLTASRMNMTYPKTRGKIQQCQD